MAVYASGEAIPLSTERGEFDSRHSRMCGPLVGPVRKIDESLRSSTLRQRGGAA